MTSASRRAQVARLRRVALAALDAYPLPEGRLRFVTHGENTTFRHDGPAGSHLVRVHRPQGHGRGVDSAAAVRSELAWLRALRAETDLEVPEVVAARDGATTVTTSAGDLTRVCSVLRWMDGRILERSARPVHLRRLGAAMARLHAHADGWTPPPDFERIAWDHEAFFGDVMVYGETSRPTAGRCCHRRCGPASRRSPPAPTTCSAATSTGASSTRTSTWATRCSTGAGCG